MFAIDHTDKAGFFTGKMLFDDDPMAGLTECTSGKHVFYCIDSLCFGLCHNHTLTRGKTVGLDDYGSCLGFNIVNRGFDFGEALIAGCRDLVPGEKIFGKGF